MAWTNNFIIPLVKVLFLEGIAIFLLYALIRPAYRTWNKRWRWVAKYKAGRHPIDKDMLAAVKGMEEFEIKKKLLLEDFTVKQINELLYLKNLIGGKQNVR